MKKTRDEKHDGGGRSRKRNLKNRENTTDNKNKHKKPTNSAHDKSTTLDAAADPARTRRDRETSACKIHERA